MNKWLWHFLFSQWRLHNLEWLGTPLACQHFRGSDVYWLILMRLSAYRLTYFGDKFGESLGGSQATPSFWKVPRLPRKFPKLPRKFFGDFPGSSLTVELNSNSGVPWKFLRLPRKFPGLPRKFPGLPRRSALSLGSLTRSPDSQKLSLKYYKLVRPCNLFSNRFCIFMVYSNVLNYRSGNLSVQTLHNQTFESNARAMPFSNFSRR